MSDSTWLDRADFVDVWKELDCAQVLKEDGHTHVGIFKGYEPVYFGCHQAVRAFSRKIGVPFDELYNIDVWIKMIEEKVNGEVEK